ncbi:EF-hand domain-containing protein [Cochlodiniinecator piscidefendens]|uniref:EF-hand domain-containing protein n=1 Tax=Cochlodiniinecator piscidefendens TaxID=2715756 RepID=UPI001407A0CC|nr:EF-hand domain-containing protein [Cochlodiniinecator piscidefendens]
MKQIITHATAITFFATLPAFAGHVADTNGDEVITFSELQAVLPDLTEEVFIQADTDNNGLLSEQEMLNAVDTGIIPPFES